MTKGDDTRRAILDEALDLASRVGFDGLTIGVLAEQTGMSKSGLFAHFRSKEQLQLQTLAHGRQRFIDTTVRPALEVPRGEKRLRELFDRWLVWETEVVPGGCIFIAGSVEFDDQPGPMRDALARDQDDWVDSIAIMAGAAVSAGDFRADLDVGQFAFDFQAITLAYNHFARLLRDERAADRARASFEALLDRARAH